MRVFATRNFLTIVFALIAAIMIAFSVISFGAGSNVFDKTYKEAAFESDSTNLADAGAFSLTSNTTCVINVEGLTLDQSWVFLKTIVIDSNDKVVYDFQFNLSNYHGYEGGESWSEGSKSDSKVFRLPAGDYKLLVYGEDEPSKAGAVGGEARTMTIKGADGKPITIKLPKTNLNFGMEGYSTIDRNESVKVTIEEGILLSRYFIFLAILFGGLTILFGWFSSNYPVVEHVSAYDEGVYGDDAYHGGEPMSDSQYARNEQDEENVFNIDPDEYQDPSKQEPS